MIRILGSFAAPLGVLAGLVVYRYPGRGLAAALAVIVMALFLRWIGSRLLACRRLTGALLFIESSLLILVAATSGLSLLALWLADVVSNATLKTQQDADSISLETVKGMIVGATASYLCTLWATGKWYESSIISAGAYAMTQVKEKLRDAIPSEARREYAAAFLSNVPAGDDGASFSGWGPEERWRRIHILTEYFDRNPDNTPRTQPRGN